MMIADELRVQLAAQLSQPPAPRRSYFLQLEDVADDWSGRLRPDHVQDVAIKEDLPAALVLSSDWHGGARHTDYKALRADLGRIAHTPGAYLLAVGDLIHNHKPQRKSGSALYESIMPPDEQDDWLSDVTAELRAADKLLGVISGNHEMMDTDESGRHTLMRWAERACVPYFGHGGAFYCHIGSQCYTAVIRHSYPGSDRISPSRAVYQRFERPRGCAHLDFTYLGHRHQNVFYPADYGAGECIHLCGGSYLRYNEVFDARVGAGYSAVGNPTVLLWPHPHRLEGFKGNRLEFALDALTMVRAAEEGALRHVRTG